LQKGVLVQIAPREIGEKGGRGSGDYFKTAGGGGGAARIDRADERDGISGQLTANEARTLGESCEKR